MRWDKIRLIGLQTVDLPVKGVKITDSYIFKGADGIGPTEVDVIISRSLGQAGTYQGRRPQAREIVIRVGLGPNWSGGQTAADLREVLYGLLTPGYEDYMLVQFMLDETVLTSNKSWVKRCEIVPFAKDPEVQLTIACLDANLLAPVTDGPVLASLNKTIPIIQNTGSASSGFSMDLTFTAAQAAGWTLWDKELVKKMYFNYPFASGDQLIFDTRPGKRKITRVRAGVPLNIVGYLSADSTWFMLYGGANYFNTSNQSFNWNLVFFDPQYLGV